ncbi:MAG: hypothetical protein EA396_11715 [Anaerolineaceae bacterium]|nr:MAG: hypothetical protein EA396_11715 [Anaerolineaceae bacterium]
MSYDNHLRRLPLFANMPPQHLEWAKSAMRDLRFDVGETVFKQGDEAKGMYMFISGRGKLVRTAQDGSQQVLASVGMNQYLNEAALFKPGEESATLQITEQARILYISRRRLREIVGYHPEMKRYLPIPDDVARARRREQHFDGQRESEEVLLSTRRHWWAIARWMWLPVLILAAFSAVGVNVTIPALSLTLIGLGVVLSGLAALYIYAEWRNDQVIITSQRVIRIERTIITLDEHRSEIPLSSIQQVNAEKVVPADLFSRFMDYGTVEVRTAGQGGNLILTLIPDPEGVQDLIFDNRSRRHQEQEREHRQSIRAEVDRVLSGQDPDIEPDERAIEQESVYITHPPRGFLPTIYTDDDGNTVYRKHAFYYMRRTSLPVFVMLCAVVLLLFAGRFGLMAYAGAGGLFFFGLMWFWWVDWDWRHDYYVVGDEMIQLIHRRPLFLQDEDDQVLLERVDNVIARRTGIFQALFNYGVVKISLIGGNRDEHKLFEHVSNPSVIQEEITRRQQRWRSRQDTDAERRRREEIAEYLGVYHETYKSRLPGGIPSGGHEPPTPSHPAPDRGTSTGAPARPPRVPRRRPNNGGNT